MLALQALAIPNYETQQCPGVNRSEPCPWAKRVSLEEEAEKALLRKRQCNNTALGRMSVGEVFAALEQAVTLPVSEGHAPDYEYVKWVTYPALARVADPQHICEIGLNSGRSAAMWLCSFPRATYHSFDIGMYNKSVYLPQAPTTLVNVTSSVIKDA